MSVFQRKTWNVNFLETEMIILQFLLSILTPAAMTAAGVRMKRKVPVYNDSRLAYRSARAKQSEEAWTFANRLFANILVTAGINLLIISGVFFIVAACMNSGGWMLSAALFLVELAGSVLIIRVVTEGILRRTFDKNGELIENEEDDEDEEELTNEAEQKDPY